MERLRVIQWTTGKAGKLSTRAILDDPRLELVGVYAHSADKAGADTVIYTPFMADVDHAVRLLDSGLDVISTNLFLNVGGIQGETKERLAAACERGDSSLYITGVNPGWINSISAALTAVCRDVRSVAVSESADVSVYESAETWQALGFSLPEASPAVIELAKVWLSTFYDSVQRMRVALGYELDDMKFVIEYATAAERVDLGWFVMERDTIAAVRSGWNGKVNGRTVVQSNVAWYLTKKLNEGWEFDDDHYHVVITGGPDVDVRIRFLPPDSWGNHEWDTMTALPAVSSAFEVAAAPAGILTLADVGLPRAPAAAWRSG